MNAPSPEVRAALTEMRRAIESTPRLTMDARERLWSAFGHLRDVLYREAGGDGSTLTPVAVAASLSFSDSPIVTCARAGE